MVEKVLLMKKNLVAVLFRQRSIPSYSQTGVMGHLHEFGRFAEK